MEQNIAVPAAPPSPLRTPLTILLGITAPPLALLAWILLSGGQRAVYLRSLWVRSGLAITLLGALPLLGMMAASALGLLADPNPNPIGLGLLFLATAVTGCGMVMVGVMKCEGGRGEAEG